jgi:hypothetical protein
MRKRKIRHLSLLDKETTRLQEILGTLLYYAQAVDSTMLTALGTIAMQQSKGTKATMQAVVQLLNYCATQPEDKVRYVACNMILHVDSDASYLTAPKARSRAGGYHYLSNQPKEINTLDNTPITANGAINVLCQVMHKVVSSAAEAELAALFHNAKEACSIRTMLKEMGHIQLPTPIQTD